MFDEIESLFAQVIVDVDPLWVAGICHAVVTNEDDVNNFCKISGPQSVLKILSKEVNRLQGVLPYT